MARAGLDKQDLVDATSQLSAAFTEGCGCQRKREDGGYSCHYLGVGKVSPNSCCSGLERKMQKDIKVFSLLKDVYEDKYEEPPGDCLSGPA